MFETPKFSVFMQKASIEGRKEEKVIRFVFYVTPITHVLATQLSPDVAKLLFVPDGHGAMNPNPVLENPDFNVGSIPLQRMYLHPSDDEKMDGHGVLLDRAKLSHFSAKRLFADDPNYTLEFRVEVPKDELSVNMMSKFYDEKLFLTFEAMQNELPLSKGKCGHCDDPAVAQDSKDSFLCGKHVKKGKGDIRYFGTAETAAEAAKK